MKKPIFVILLASLLSAAAFSQEVTRYKGFAVGVFGTNQYGLASWNDYAKASAGAGISAEYTLPLALPHNLDLGVSVRADWAHIFPKSDSTLKRGDDITALLAAWIRVPFSLFGQSFAFQPEVGYGVIFHNAKGQNGSDADGWYTDQVVSFAPALRWVVPKNDAIEVELAPFYTVATENDHALNQLGFRLGAVWHFNGTKE